jgi:hypothetical protein
MRITSVVLIVIIISLLFTNKCSKDNSESFKKRLQNELIKNDKLTLDKEGIYRKYVSDSLTKKQLNKKVRDLEIKVKNPIIVEKIVLRPVDVSKKPDTVFIEGKNIKITDYYPSKQDAFLRYNFLKNNNSEVSKFTFIKDLNIDLVIVETDLGILEAKIKAPNFIKLGNVEIDMLPNKIKQKSKKFGFLIGAGLDKNKNKEMGITVNTGLRYNKTYLQIQATTNQSIGISLTKEF